MLLYDPKLIGDEVQSYFTDNIETNRNNLLKIVSVLSELTEAVANAKIEFKPSQGYCSTLIQKIIISSLSIVKLAEGSNLNLLNKNVNTQVIDSSSIFTLTRSTLECYLTLYYIYFDDVPEDQKDFRFRLWQISGLISRQNFEGDNNFLKQKKSDERKVIDHLLEELKAHTCYTQLNSDKRAKLNNYGLPRLESFNAMIKKSNLKQSQFANMYSYFSNHAHSEYLATLQQNQGSMNIQNQTNNSMVSVSLVQVLMLNAATIHLLKNKFTSADLIYNALPITLTSAVDTFANIAFGKRKAK